MFLLQKESTAALKLYNLGGIFYILLGGLVLALIVSVFEFLYKTQKDAIRTKVETTYVLQSTLAENMEKLQLNLKFSGIQYA